VSVCHLSMMFLSLTQQLTNMFCLNELRYSLIPPGESVICIKLKRFMESLVCGVCDDIPGNSCGITEQKLGTKGENRHRLT